MKWQVQHAKGSSAELMRALNEIDAIPGAFIFAILQYQDNNNDRGHTWVQDAWRIVYRMATEADAA